MPVLKQLRFKLQARAAECYSLCRELDIEIARREGEPPRRPRGFQIVPDWDGTGILRDWRNRLGRPQKNVQCRSVVGSHTTIAVS
jgi:hypothetical protein